MKKLITIVSVLLICVTAICAFVACNERDDGSETNTGLTAAKEYLFSLYRDAAVETNSDFTRTAALRNEQGTYTVTWTATVTEGPQTVTVVVNDNGTVTIDVQEVDDTILVDTLYTLTAVITDADGNTETLTFNHKIPKYATLTVAEFLALEEDKDKIYAVEGYVVASGADEGSKASFVIGDETGAIFSYNKFEVFKGDKVVVFGTRTSNSGLPQIGTTEVRVVEENSASFTEATATELDGTTLDLSTLSKDTIANYAGKYYKITGSTLVKSDSGYTNANYNDKQLLSLYVSETLAASCADLYDQPVNVYGYVRGCSTGNYLTVQVAKIEYAGEGELVVATPAEKVAYEKEGLSLKDITVAGDVELTTAGDRYTDVEISWALATTTAATLAENTLTVAALPAENVEITLTATLKCGEATDTKDITIKVCAPAKSFIKKALAAGAALADKATTPDSYIIIGTISEITAAYNDTYKNVTFNVTDGVDTIMVFRYNLEDASTLAVGDAIAIAAPIQKWGSDIEAVSTFVKLDVMGLKAAADAGLGSTGVDGTMVYGQVEEINYAYSSQHDNISFTITDGTNDLYCYRVAGGADIAVGDYVLVTGKPSSYNSAAQMAQGATYNKTGIYTAPVVDEEGGDTPEINGTYSYTFTAKQFSANGTVALGSVDWTLDGNGGYWGWDNNNGKGQQLGSGGSPYTSMTLVSESLENVTSIKIKTAGATGIEATLTVFVGETQVGEAITLVRDMTEYTFTAPEALTGPVKFVYSQTSSKALYILEITIVTDAE